MTVVRPGPLRPVVVALAAAAITGWVVVRVVSGPAPAPVELVAGTPIPSAVASSSSNGAAPAVAVSPAAQLVVHVIGDVRRPGLVRLAPGSRVADAVAAAGGLTRGGGSGALNLARLVVDGEQIVVSPDAAPSADPAAAGSATTAVINLNTATAVDLDTLPGVGLVMSARILEWRTAHGRFSSVDQLREISGIGARTFERLAPHVRV